MTISTLQIIVADEANQDHWLKLFNSFQVQSAILIRGHYAQFLHYALKVLASVQHTPADSRRGLNCVAGESWKKILLEISVSVRKLWQPS